MNAKISCSTALIYGILYTVYCILYTVYCIRYTVYCILYLYTVFVDIYH